MNEFENAAFTQQYSAEPLRFETADSTHFVCKYAYRENDTVYQFTPAVIPTRKDFLSKLRDLLPTVIGDERAKRCDVTHVVDEGIEGGEGICLIVPGFTSKTLSSSRTLSTKLLTDFHNALS